MLLAITDRSLTDIFLTNLVVKKFCVKTVTAFASLMDCGGPYEGEPHGAMERQAVVGFGFG